MKKIFVGLTVTIGCAFFSSLSAYANDITVNVAGMKLDFEQPPVVVEGRTLVPFRAIYEALGADVDWNADKREVTGTRGNTTISMTIDKPEMRVNEETIELDVPAQIVNSRTMVPVRAVSDGLDETVSWNPDTKTVDIKTSMIYQNDALKEYIDPEWTEKLGLEIYKSSEYGVDNGAITFDSYVFDTYIDENGKEQSKLSEIKVAMNTAFLSTVKGSEAKEKAVLQGAIDVDKLEQKAKEAFGDAEWYAFEYAMYPISIVDGNRMSWYDMLFDNNLDIVKYSTDKSGIVTGDEAVIMHTEIVYNGNVYNIAFSKQNLYSDGKVVYVLCLPKDYNDLAVLETGCAPFIQSDADAVKYMAGEGESIGYMSRGEVTYPLK